MAKSKNTDEDAEKDVVDVPSDADQHEASEDEVARENSHEDPSDSGEDAESASSNDVAEDGVEPHGYADVSPEDDRSEEIIEVDASEDPGDVGDMSTSNDKEVMTEETAPEPTSMAQSPVPEKASPVPLVIGGVIAGAIGFGAAYLGLTNAQGDGAATLQIAVESQAAQIATLEAQIAVLEADIASAEPPDISGELDDLRQELLAAIPDTPDLSGDLDVVRAQLDEVTARLAALASEATGGASDVTAEELEAFRAELSAAMDSAQSDLQAAVDAAQAELEAARVQAAEVEAEAEAAATLAAAEAALAQVAASLDAGTSYSGALTRIEGAGLSIPNALAENAAIGVPTLPALTESFPAAARAALNASIDMEDTNSPTDRVMAFLRVQTGARSLTPREGDDPDAILSRAEAALRSGDLETAQSELEGLPDGGQAAMSDWIAQAESRQSALQALTDLRTEIETK